jgi:putative sigma-54 modulation protein
MRIDFQARNHDLPDRFVDHATPRLEDLPHFSERLRETRVLLTGKRGLHDVEITCDIGGHVLRAIERDSDPLSAFDHALEKLQRQITRYKDRLVDRRKRGAGVHRGVEAPAVEPEPEPEEVEALAMPVDFEIVRVKSHTLKPMTPEEAVLQMEMLGHDFFVFFDGSADRVGVVYRRRDGGYGLIEPEVAGEESEE